MCFSGLQSKRELENNQTIRILRSEMRQHKLTISQLQDDISELKMANEQVQIMPL